jgi:membrane associated rhomboid family serine protease
LFLIIIYGDEINTNDDIEENGEWAAVYTSQFQQPCSERALVLLSVGIPYQVVSEGSSQFALVVPASVAEKAKFEIWEYEQENQVTQGKQTIIAPNYEKSLPGVIGYLIVVMLVAWLSEISAFGHNWLAAGRVDGVMLRDGEWWRAITALTLHGDLKHILGNMIFGAFFGILAGGLIGPGIAWLSILVSAALANTLNAFLLDEAHRAIGASTAVFAALGLVSGFVWRSKLMAQEKWAWRLGPVVGGLALLAYTGTGGPNTDVGAHLAGFICGFGSGMIVTRLKDISGSSRIQLVSGFLALLIIFIAWTIALRTSP